MTTEPDTLHAALEYARRAWHVFPVNGKRPRTTHGLKAATTDPERIRDWWELWPDAGVAIRTGAVSGLLVLDVDPEHGGADTLHELEQQHGALPETPRAETGGGGEHYYFAHAAGIGNSAGKLGAGLDVRGDGGFVVAPPSPHPSGRSYLWDVPPEVADLRGSPALQPSPRWLLEKLTAPTNGAAAPAGEWRELAARGVGVGARNNATARLAGHLLARGVDPFVALELVLAWNAKRNTPPLTEDEVARTVASIARKEREQWL